MIGTAIGLAYSGYTPLCYSITPFLLYRPFEMLRNYVNHELVPIKLIGSGRDKDYSHDGFTHWSEDDVVICKAAFPRIRVYKPLKMFEDTFQEFITSENPAYLNLARF